MHHFGKKVFNLPGPSHFPPWQNACVKMECTNASEVLPEELGVKWIAKEKRNILLFLFLASSLVQ
jgi:hypothetical protein